MIWPTVAVPPTFGDAVLTGSVGIPASTLPLASPITHKIFDGHARPEIALPGSPAELDQVAAPNGGVVEPRTSPLSSAARHTVLVGQVSCVIASLVSMLAEDGGDQFAAANGATAVSTWFCESIATHAVLVGHAS